MIYMLLGCSPKILQPVPAAAQSWMAVQPVIDVRGRKRIVLDDVPDRILVDGEPHTAVVTGGGVEATWITAETGELCITGPVRCAPLPDLMAPRVLRVITPETARLDDRFDATWSAGSWRIQPLEGSVLEHKGHRFGMGPTLDGVRYGLDPGTNVWVAERGDRRETATLPASTTWVGWHGDHLLYAGDCIGTWKGETLPICTGREPFPVGSDWGTGIGDTVAIVGGEQIRFEGPTAGALLVPETAVLTAGSCAGEPVLMLDDWFVRPTATGAIASRTYSAPAPWKRYQTCDGETIPLGDGKAACVRADANGTRFVSLGRF